MHPSFANPNIRAENLTPTNTLAYFHIVKNLYIQFFDNFLDLIFSFEDLYGLTYSWVMKISSDVHLIEGSLMRYGASNGT